VSTDEPIALPVTDTDDEEVVDHPDDLTDEEAEEGRKVYEAVDDTDDTSTGLDA
jgi:hypothetical protein